MLDDKRAEEDADGGPVGAAGGKLSAHEQRVARMAQRARRLEEENMGEKDWFMRGETKAGACLSSSLVSHCASRALTPGWHLRVTNDKLPYGSALLGFSMRIMV